MAAAIAVSSVGACSLFTSLDGLAGDASAPDAPTDAPPADVATDVASDVALSDGGFCDGVDAIVCTNFDQGALLSGGWSGQELSAQSSVALADANAYSPPLALRAVTTADDSGTAAIARLNVLLSQSLVHIHVSARLYVPSSGFPKLVGPADPIEILCSDDVKKTYSGFWLRLYPSKQEMYVDGATFLLALPYDQWTHFELDVQYGITDAGAPSHMVVTVDGVVQENVDTPEAPCTKPRLELNAGVSAAGNFTTYVDDVIVQGE